MWRAPGGVGDDRRILLVLRDVEVDADKDALVLDVDGINQFLVERHGSVKGAMGVSAKELLERS